MDSSFQLESLEHERISQWTDAYSNEIHEGDWKDAPEAVAAVEQGRNRKLTDDERRQYKESWTRVFEYLHQRGASGDEDDRVRALAERFIKEMEETSADDDQK